MLASLRDVPGQGSAFCVRARDAAGQFWDWVGSAWVGSETSNCRTLLTEQADGAESRYQATLVLPGGDLVLEYVRVAGGEVVAEDTPSSTSAGTGTGTGVLTVSAAAGASPLVGATVVLQSTASGAVLGLSTTDANGRVVFAHPGGAFRLLGQLAGYSFSSPTFSLSVGEVAAQALTATAVVVVPAASPAECVVYATLRNLDGTPRAGVVGAVQLTKLPTLISGSYFVGQEVPATSSSSGLIQWPVPRGAKLRVSVPGVWDRKLLLVPDAATLDLGA